MFRMMLGEVDSCEEHFIGTHFVSFVGPLFPTYSMYVTEQHFSYENGVSAQSWSGVQLPIYWKSVFLGYLRVWLMFLVFAAPFYLMWGETADFDRPEWLVSLGFFVLWIATFFFGRLSNEEKQKRRIWGSVVGLMLEPARLGDMDRRNRIFKLAELLEKVGFSRSAQDPELFVRDILETVGEPKEIAHEESGKWELFCLAYTYASYQAVKQKDWQTAAEELWSSYSIK